MTSSVHTLEMIQNMRPQATHNVYMYLYKTVDQKGLNLAFVVSRTYGDPIVVNRQGTPFQKWVTESDVDES